MSGGDRINGMANNQCLICDRLQLIKQNNNPCFVIELETGVVVFGDHQFYPGYTVFLSKQHCSELHQLDAQVRQKFLCEMSLVAEAVFKVFQPVKMNYELLGNKDDHLHWHLYPRYQDDPDPHRPIWAYPKEKRCNEQTRISEAFVKHYQPLLVVEIKEILVTECDRK